RRRRGVREHAAHLPPARRAGDTARAFATRRGRRARHPRGVVRTALADAARRHARRVASRRGRRAARPQPTHLPAGPARARPRALGPPGLPVADVLRAVPSVSSGTAVLELVLPLAVGARVVMVSHEVAADGARLAQALRAAGATIMQATPITWTLLLDAGWSG